jgi:hypothetical protein
MQTLISVGWYECNGQCAGPVKGWHSGHFHIDLYRTDRPLERPGRTAWASLEFYRPTPQDRVEGLKWALRDLAAELQRKDFAPDDDDLAEMLG